MIIFLATIIIGDASVGMLAFDLCYVDENYEAPKDKRKYLSALLKSPAWTVQRLSLSREALTLWELKNFGFTVVSREEKAIYHRNKQNPPRFH